MSSSDWPDLPFAEWETTLDTVHMWTQIVGKTRLALTPLENHWWNVPLYVTARGLTTSPMPFAGGTFDVELDFIAHELRLRLSDGREHGMRLYPRSVADFHAEYMASLRSLGVDVRIHRLPCEFDDPTPFDEDQHHASYDTGAIERFRRSLVSADRVLKKFRTGFIGKSSPVHFFWGSFDLAVTRFSGRRAPQKPDVDAVTREAYSHEVISCGWWPGDRKYPRAAFYAYAAPPPAGFDKEAMRPAAAHWDATLGLFRLDQSDVSAAPDPDGAILDFCQSTYEAGARLAQWDRATLERAEAAGA